MSIEIEKIILRNLTYNEDYTRKVIPFLKKEYFFNESQKYFFDCIINHFDKYNTLASKETLLLDTQKLKIKIDIIDSIKELIEENDKLKNEKVNNEWLLDTTEEFCKNKALYLGLMESISIADGAEDKSNISKTAIPDILSKALAVSFDTNIGHNYLKDINKRYEYYNEKVHKIKFHLDSFNKITNGGAERKTLNCVIAGCVHPDTKIKIRYKKSVQAEYNEVCIKDIQTLLSLGYEIEVDSPDGWVGVTLFVDKGKWKEYNLIIEDQIVVRCNENHLFETDFGWLSAKTIEEKLKETKVLTKDGYKTAIVRKTKRKIPIVDINVDHKNSRYYTNGVSSHNTGIGKSIFLCDLAANYMKAGRNVLYISLEMADMKLGKRIDANLMNVSIDEVAKMPKLLWDEKVKLVKEKCKGELVFKEYPTSSANTNHFRFLIRELKQKKSFIPDVIIIDYINICASVRYKNAAESYGYMKGVTEELRALMIETNTVGFSGIQFNRQGLNNSDADITNVGESMAITHILDLLFAIISTEDLVKTGQVMIKQLKSRYGDVNSNSKFMIGIDRPKMRFYDLNNSGLSFSTNTTPLATKSTINSLQQPIKTITKGIKI